jgi:hypothetical protein
MNRRFCLTLDLKDDPKLIAEYRRRQGRSIQPASAGVGKSDVEVPAIIAPGETRGEMAADGKNFRLGELTFFCYEAIQVSKTNP